MRTEIEQILREIDEGKLTNPRIAVERAIAAKSAISVIDEKNLHEIAAKAVRESEWDDIDGEAFDAFRVGFREAQRLNAVASERMAELEAKLARARRALQDAKFRFMAMGNSTMENGVPSAEALISMCEESAIFCQQALAEIGTGEG